MATFTSKFGIGDLVHISMQATYFQNPPLLKIYKVVLEEGITRYSVQGVDIPANTLELIAEKDLILAKE